MAKFMLETSYPSRQIIRQSDNSSKNKSEDEFLPLLRGGKVCRINVNFLTCSSHIPRNVSIENNKDGSKLEIKQ